MPLDALAVDVALIPPPEMTDMAIRINRELQKTGRPDIALDAVECVPHITLAMGCMLKKHLGSVAGILDDITGNISPIRLETVPAADGSAWIEIVRTEDLERLHEEVMMRVLPFFVFEPSRGMFSRKKWERVNATTLNYINVFRAKYAFEKYTPHITLGTGRMNIPAERIDVLAKSIGFTCDTISLCHLGNSCTCRKVIHSCPLHG